MRRNTGLDNRLEIPNFNEVQFTIPIKRIYDSQGTQDFQSSAAIYRLKYFLAKYVNMVSDMKIPDDSYISDIPLVNEMVKLLTTLSKIIDLTPPLAGPRRYGNMACRDWHMKVDKELPSLLRCLLSKQVETDDTFLRCIPELEYYLGNSFGSSTRLDYGTGHELSFMAVVAGIDMLGMLNSSFSGKDILFIFNAYYELIKKLILTYTLEPAGSHGVWGLDDHFHLVYILGSSQFNTDPNPPLRPSDVTNKQIVHKYSNVYLYCKAIDFIYTVKSGPFSEHSPILSDISNTVKLWSKVQSGLTKMYMVEVLNKFPVVQHFWFGNGFYPWVDQQSKSLLPTYVIDNDFEKGNPRIQTSLPKNLQAPSVTFMKPSRNKSNVNSSIFPTLTTRSPRMQSPISRFSSSSDTFEGDSFPQTTSKNAILYTSFNNSTSAMGPPNLHDNIRTNRLNR